MPCPHCTSPTTSERTVRTQLGYRPFTQRSYRMRGFGSSDTAAHFGRAFDELRPFERHRRVRAEMGALAEQRQRSSQVRRH